MRAVINNCTDCLAAILDYDANINVQDSVSFFLLLFYFISIFLSNLLISSIKLSLSILFFTFHFSTTSIYTIFTTLYSIFQNGSTALHIAFCNYKHTCIRLLIIRGADSEIKDNEGKTAFDNAGEKYGTTEEQKEETKAVIRQALVSNVRYIYIYIYDIYI